MEDVDESSSEDNIKVTGIVNFSGSPHNVNKKAYSFEMGKGVQSEYSSRLGSNMLKLPEGEYTLAIEFFPPSTTNLSVNVVSPSLNIGQQSTKLFVNYSRSIVHLDKWSITPGNACQCRCIWEGTASSPTRGIGHMIVYGIKGSQNDVDSSVYDTAYVIENGKMVMQTDLSMNGHLLRNSVHHINGFLDSKKGNNRFTLNGAEIISLPSGATLTKIAVYCRRKVSSGGHVSAITHRRISLKSFSSSKSFFFWESRLFKGFYFTKGWVVSDDKPKFF